MSTKKMSTAEARLSALKKLGILKEIKKPTKANPLTKTQEAKIRDVYKSVSAAANTPSNFTKISLKNLQKTDIQNLKKSGYMVYGNTAFVGKQGYDKVSIKKDYVKTDDGLKRVVNIVRKTNNGRKIEEEIVASAGDKFNLRERLQEEYTLKRIKNGDYFGLKVFDNGFFERRIFTDFDSMMNYLEHDISVNTKDISEDDFKNNIHIVKIKIKDISEMYELGESKKKAANRRQYANKKNKALRGNLKKKK